MSTKATSRYVRLLENKIYPTYQLFAVMANGKTAPKDGLRIGALTVMEWLRQRMGDNVPPELQQPGPGEYRETDESNLPSLHIDKGYIINILSMPSEGQWSLMIAEPDLGSNPGDANQARAAVPGRVITTNIGFKIWKDTLECGFQTVVSDPDVGADLAEVYRLAVVRRLFENPEFGLSQIIPLEERATELSTKADIRKLMTLMKDNQNRLPSVVFTYMEGKEATYGGIAAGGKLPVKPKKAELAAFAAGNTVAILGEERMLVKSVSFTDAKEPELPYDAHEFARHNKACCRTYILGEKLRKDFAEQASVKVKEGDIVCLYPVKDETEPETVSYTPNEKERAKRLEQLSRKIYAYPRGRGL